MPRWNRRGDMQRHRAAPHHRDNLGTALPRAGFIRRSRCRGRTGPARATADTSTLRRIMVPRNDSTRRRWASVWALALAALVLNTSEFVPVGLPSDTGHARGMDADHLRLCGGAGIASVHARHAPHGAARIADRRAGTVRARSCRVRNGLVVPDARRGTRRHRARAPRSCAQAPSRWWSGPPCAPCCHCFPRRTSARWPACPSCPGAWYWSACTW